MIPYFKRIVSMHLITNNNKIHSTIVNTSLNYMNTLINAHFITVF